jgi:hypothetical protein
LNRSKKSAQYEEEKENIIYNFSKKEFEEKENKNHFQNSKTNDRHEKEEQIPKQNTPSANVLYDDGNFEQSFEDNLNIAEILEDGEDFDDQYLEDFNMDLELDKLSPLTPMNFSPGSVIKEVSIIKEESCLTNDKIHSSHLKEELISHEKEEKVLFNENLAKNQNEPILDTPKKENEVKYFIK